MRLSSASLRSLIFGIEDSLVSTSGVIVGVSAGSHNPKVVLLAGFVAVAVEAVSMAAGNYLSERAVVQAEGKRDNTTNSAVIMFFSYALSGLALLLPLIFLPYPLAVQVAVAMALAGLFLLGYLKGKLVGVTPSRSGLEMLVIGGTAALIGMTAGLLFNVPN